VYNPGAAYPESRFVSAVGYGLNRESADKDALGALVSVFGQSVEGEIRTSYRYSEALAGGLLDNRENSEINSAVKTSFAMDTLVGAEIKDRWFDGRDTHYAIAVMDRSQGALLYRNLIAANEGIIQKLVDLPPEDRYSFDAYARYELAGAVADADAVFLNVLSVLNPAAAALAREGLRPGEDYRLAAREIAGNIPVALRVNQDPNGRIGAAFSSVISGAGFRTGEGSRYTLEVSVSFTDVDLPQNPNKFVRYVIDARLSAGGQVLFPYNINGREGHTTQAEALNRAVRAAEEKIREGFGAAFNAYLGGLSPKLDT
jgi:hypothetical protein